MSLTDQIQTDFKNIVENTSEFGVSMTFTNQAGTETATVVGFHTKHHTSLTGEEEIVSSMEASIAVSEDSLTDAGYTVRNSDNEVAMIRHKVDVADSTGSVKNYEVQEHFPDEKIGAIVFLLIDYDRDWETHPPCA